MEDSEDDVIIAMRAFKKSHLTNKVIALSDGQECIDYLFGEGEYQGKAHDLPVFIMLDLNMPRVDGFGVLETLSQNERTKKIPIVVLTTSDAEHDMEKAYSLGANSYITKPVQSEHFFKTIQDLEIYWTVLNKQTSMI